MLPIVQLCDAAFTLGTSMLFLAVPNQFFDPLTGPNTQYKDTDGVYGNLLAFLFVLFQGRSLMICEELLFAAFHDDVWNRINCSAQVMAWCVLFGCGLSYWILYKSRSGWNSAITKTVVGLSLFALLHAVGIGLSVGCTTYSIL